MPCHKCSYYSYVAMVQSLTVENFKEYDEWPIVYQNFLSECFSYGFSLLHF